MSKSEQKRKIYRIGEKLWGWRLKKVVWESNARCVNEALQDIQAHVWDAEVFLSLDGHTSEKFLSQLEIIEKKLKRIEKRLIGKIKLDPEHHVCSKCNWVDNYKKP